jgi:hypothetical protein
MRTFIVTDITIIGALVKILPASQDEFSGMTGTITAYHPDEEGVYILIDRDEEDNNPLPFDYREFELI